MKILICYGVFSTFWCRKDSYESQNYISNAVRIKIIIIYNIIIYNTLHYIVIVVIIKRNIYISVLGRF